MGQNNSCINHKTVFHRGDLVLVNLGQHKGLSVQSGIRPCVILSNNMSNQYSTILNVFPMTTQIKECPVHVIVGKTDVNGYLKESSCFLGEQPVTIGKSQVLRKVGHISEESDTMKRIAEAIMLQLGLSA